MEYINYSKKAIGIKENPVFCKMIPPSQEYIRHMHVCVVC